MCVVSLLHIVFVFLTDTTVSVGPNDYLLNTLYYDFAKSHPDFYKVTSELKLFYLS